MNDRVFFDHTESRRGNFLKLQSQNMATDEGDLFELENWINRGGNAAVFRCKERTSGDDYAVKFLLRTGSRHLERFRREIRLLQLIDGDHIIKYQGSGTIEAEDNRDSQIKQVPFVVMELATLNLDQYISSAPKPLSYEIYAGQFRGLATALSILHNHAVHRDIKPENILVVGERWLLSDYGLCTFVNPDEIEITQEGENVGPRYWLSPEAQNRRLRCNDEIGAASDVFQMAAIFWYVVTGRYPGGIVTENDWTGPTKLFGVLHSSLLHDSKLRPQNGNEFLDELSNALTQ